MKKIFLALAFLPLAMTNTSSASVETKVTNKVSGENASVKTEINNVVNQKNVRVETTSPGTIKVKIKDGQVEIESDQEATPTVIISPSVEGIKEQVEQKVKEEKEIVKDEAKTIKKRIRSFFKIIFFKFAGLFRRKLDND